MRNYIRIGITVILAAAGTTACANDSSSVMENHLKAESEILSTERALMSLEGKNPAPGSLEVFSLNDYPAPAAIKEKIASGIRARSAGATIVAAEKIPDQSSILKELNSMSAAAGNATQKNFNLKIPPGLQADLSSTLLTGGKLLSTQPAGVLNKSGASGVSRVFQLQDGSIVELSEDDYVLGGTKLKLVRETFNTTVNGTPGTISSIRSIEGKGMSTLHWVTPSRSYRLVRVAQRNFDASRSEAMLTKIAASLPR